MTVLLGLAGLIKDDPELSALIKQFMGKDAHIIFGVQSPDKISASQRPAWIIEPNGGIVNEETIGGHSADVLSTYLITLVWSETKPEHAAVAREAIWRELIRAFMRNPDLDGLVRNAQLAAWSYDDQALLPTYIDQFEVTIEERIKRG